MFEARLETGDDGRYVVSALGSHTASPAAVGLDRLARLYQYDTAILISMILQCAMAHG